MKNKHNFFKRNGLLIVFMGLMLLTLGGQAYTGFEENNETRQEKNLPVIPFSQYLHSGHFFQSTFENWESEFFQMGLYVFLTVFLFQQGSAESKKLDEPEEVNRSPVPHPDAPWLVRKGGVYFSIYQNSVSLVFMAFYYLIFSSRVRDNVGIK